MRKKGTVDMPEGMTRAEHLQWCKDRALAYVEAGEISQAVASMASDMRKHPETEEHMAIDLMFQLHFAGLLDTPEEARKFILAFN